ncbi:hypothetical protein Tco_0944173 [Tanacetum coccineum]
MESSTSSQPNQPYSPINPTNLDMNFEELLFSQEYNYSQEYSMGHGSGHGSAHGSAHGSVPIHDDGDDSPVEEVSPVEPNKPSRRATKAKKDETKEAKEAPKEWTLAEEIALCQAWCDASENNIDGNSMKAKGFWEAVIRYFVKEIGSSRGYDSIVSKWKNRVRSRIGAFCAIIKNIEANHESGTNDLDVYHKACAEYKMIYKGDFTLEHCYNILKDHPASDGLNLNEEADETVKETQEFRPMGRDRAKAKKKAIGSSRGGSSSFVDLVADKSPHSGKRSPVGRRREKTDVAPENAGSDLARIGSYSGWGTLFLDQVNFVEDSCTRNKEHALTLSWERIPRLASGVRVKIGRDTIQLEDAVSTISQEYLLEFSSEYFIPENLHPELPGPGDHIVARSVLYVIMSPQSSRRGRGQEVAATRLKVKNERAVP